MTTLEHPQGKVLIQELSNGKRRLEVSVSDQNTFVSSSKWETSYPVELIQRIMEIKSPAYLCDEIRREEDSNYIAHHIETTLFAHIAPEAFVGKRLLDFGCGSGASTVILARLLPHTEIVGIELNPLHLEIAHLRANHYGLENVDFYQSPSGEELPSDLGKFDFVILPAVYEHLLPNERPRLLAQLWALLKKEGVLFIDETPHRWFPIETHTSNLPFINYLPEGIAAWYARGCSDRNLEKDDWQTLLRKGIRGGTQTEILRLIKRSGGTPRLLLSRNPLLKDPVDVWFEGYARQAEGDTGGLKRFIKPFLKVFYTITGIPLVPYLSLAIQKEK
jgi:2-polyprenyl-3-methyl-5-hydroxy-6-metoxy-1,4-benzoquinol methylase